MFKKVLAMSLFAVLLFLSPIQNLGASASAAFSLDKSVLDKGIITVNGPQSDGVQTIVRISKDDAHYDYRFINGAHYPLQLGNGTYTVMVAELIADNKYKVVTKENVELQLADENAVYLQSISLIDWNGGTKAVGEAAKLTNESMTDMEKVTAIYTYITQTIKYDDGKAQSVSNDYIPNLDAVYDASAGICYDYAAILAAMARSLNIPTRLVMGYEASAPETYHAWNQVYLKDSGTWVTVDPTYDAARVQNGEQTPILKDPENYTITQVY